MAIPDCAEPGCTLGSFVSFDGPFMPVSLCARGAAKFNDWLDREYEPRGRLAWNGDWYAAVRLWLSTLPGWRVPAELLERVAKARLPLSRAGGAR